MSLIVLKFGGTSVGNCDKIIKVAKLIKKYVKLLLFTKKKETEFW